MSVLLALFACGTSCEVEGPLDYTDSAQWICTPDDTTSCPDSLAVAVVTEDGSVENHALEAAESPQIACFAVYPTFDLRLRTGLDLEHEQEQTARKWARNQAGPLRQVCDLYVPFYRQVTFGTFLGRETNKKNECFDTAHDDVAAAFDRFLELEPDRPFAVFGHSQGGYHLTRLLQSRIEADPALRDRLVGAYPTGWQLGTAANSAVGGNFAVLPECRDATTPGCVVAYRSYLSGESPPSVGRYSTSEEAICVNPANPGDSTVVGTLAAFAIPGSHELLKRPDGVAEDDLVLFPDAFEARCTGDGNGEALEVRWARSDTAPVDLEAKSITGAIGSHILDVSLGQADIVADIERRAATLLSR